MGKKALKEARQAIKTLIASTKPPTDQVWLNPGNFFSLKLDQRNWLVGAFKAR